MKILKLHTNKKPVYVNAENIEAYVWNSENGKVNLVVNYLKGTRIEVDEALWEIDEMFNMGKLNTDDKGD
jgi:hypothetical protein